MVPRIQMKTLNGLGEYGLARAEARISSFEKKPANGGKPAMAIVAMKNVQNVMGIFPRRPPIFRMSCSPLMAWITEPEPRKRQALKKACVTTWKRPRSEEHTSELQSPYV